MPSVAPMARRQVCWTLDEAERLYKLADELHDDVDEQATLENVNGVPIGWAPEIAVPILANALRDAEERGKRMQLASSFGTWLFVMWMSAAAAMVLDLWLAWQTFWRH